MCSDMAVNAEGIGMVHVAEMLKEIQHTNNTNTTVRR